MEKVKRLLVDVSSVCWMSLLAGDDKENGYTVQHEGKEVKISSAAFGFECAINHLVASMNRFDIVPSDMILVVEGANSKSLRKSIYPLYKEGRDSRPPESYEEFNTLKAMLVEQLGAVGATAVQLDGVEGDDVLAYLAQNLDGERYIDSNDGDMAVLVGDGVHLWRRGELDENPYGPFEFKYITLYKALVGDSTDGYPGAKGFGPKAFLDLYCLFGEEGLDMMIDLIQTKKLKELQEDVGELKSLQKIVDAEAMVYTSWDCARLYPHKCNTMRKPLQWTAGMVKPITKETDERLKSWGGQVRLVHKTNYAAAVEFFKSKIEETPFFSIDIETSTPPESDDWLMTAKGKSDEDKDLGVDVFGSRLCGLAITFGANRQYTYYIPVNHVEVNTNEKSVLNVTSTQVLEVMDMIPFDIPHAIQNVGFELPILFEEWHELWDTGEWHGFIPNAWDTKIMASYVDENVSTGLKQRSESVLGYKQMTYQEVTTMTGEVGTLPAGGQWLSGVDTAEGAGTSTETRQYKMNELTAEHVLRYGADDTICTSALFNYYRLIMEIENTFRVFQAVEILPAYVTALAYVQGCKISLKRLKELEREDDIIYDEAKKTLDTFLIEKGWDGTICPEYTEITPAVIKEAFSIVMGEEFKTSVRTVSKLVTLLEEAGAHLMSKLIGDGDVAGLNKLVASRFTNEPDINFDSSKQMQKLLYHTLNLPVRIVNKLTPKEREEKKELAAAVSKFNKIWQGSKTVVMTDEEREIIKVKAATDDTAVDFALAFDATDERKKILNAMIDLKKVATRRKLYYKPYPLLTHWKDGMLHSSLNQSAAVTRRHTSGGPNLYQLPKKGEGLKVREVIVPHRKEGVVCSIDFVGQELRLMAGQSQDANMLACFIGDKLKDIHSMTASGAMAQKWGKCEVQRLADSLGMGSEGSEALYDLFTVLRKSKDVEVSKKAEDLRKDGKNVNFAAQFDAMAAKVSQMLIMSVEDAQAFLDAKYAAFPRVESWKDEVRAKLECDGFVTTMMGGRRHLAYAFTSGDKWEAERAGRQGPNFMIQGSAAEMIKLALARLWKSGILFSLDMIFIAPIYDEIVWSVAIDDSVESIKTVHECMTVDYADLGVPILGSVSLGKSFGEQIECGDAFDEDAIFRALAKVAKEPVAV